MDMRQKKTTLGMEMPFFNCISLLLICKFYNCSATQRTLLGDMFGLMSAIAYGLFTGRLFYFALFAVDLYEFSPLIVSILFQCCLKNFVERKEKRLMSKNCLVILDFLPLLLSGGLVIFYFPVPI